MKRFLLKWTAFILAVIIAISMLPANSITVYAASPSMSLTSKVVIGIDQEFALTVKSLVKSKVKSTKWYTTNKNVVTVSEGDVTSVGKGTAYIKCKITYKSGYVVTPSCKVTVKIPATGIEINNAQDDTSNNSRQVIAVGDTYDFNSVLTPSNANNYITYSISDTSYATVDKKGIVTGVKPGFVTLTAKANLNKPADYQNALDDILNIKDSINLEIVTKTASVTSVVLEDTTTLTVTFDDEIDESTIMDENDELLNSITVTAKMDNDGVTASSPGILYGSLSSDKKTLTITTSGYFNGLYGIHFSSYIQTTDSQPLMEYYSTLSLYDTTPPDFKNYTVDDTGLIVSINFTESMDYSDMQIESVDVASSSDTAKSSTISKLIKESNYVASDDGKSLTIDLSNITSLDRDKKFKLVFSGLKDRVGNYPDGDQITAYLATDTTPKAQAKLVSLERTDYDTLTAIFTRSIDEPGQVLLSNDTEIDGEVSEDDPKQVTYTLDSDSAKLTGTQKVQIGYWDGFNVKSSDDSADEYQTVKVDFNIDSTIPELSDYELVIDTDDDEYIYNLILTFDKDVTLVDDEGTFTAKLVTEDGEVYKDYDIGYTAEADDNVVTVELDSDDFDEIGTYTITIPEEFVEDDYGNTNLEETVKVENTESSSAALPDPKKIVQSDDDASIIYVTFANKIDEETAEDEDNYDIDDAEIESVELTSNTSSGATVTITLVAGCITETGKYTVTISGIAGYHNTYTEMEEYETKITLHENTGPEIEDVTYKYPDTITITFDETLDGTASFKVMQNGSNLAESSEISGKKIVITLDEKPTMDVSMQIIPNSSNAITDKYGNLAEVETQTITPTK